MKNDVFIEKFEKVFHKQKVYGDDTECFCKTWKFIHRRFGVVNLRFGIWRPYFNNLGKPDIDYTMTNTDVLKY